MKDFIDAMQCRTAVTAVGPSALRGQGKGVLKGTQEFLSKIDLSELTNINRNTFNQWLDEQTDSLLIELPIRNKPWGTCRKALNLFLRDSLYNQYLCEAFIINAIEQWLEIPLDSAVAKGLKREAGRGRLPMWPGLKNLRKDVSEDFQRFAERLAEKRGIARVHLDIYLWIENR
jgi:hypothetical protein